MRKFLALLLTAVISFSFASAQNLGNIVREVNTGINTSFQKELRKADPQRKTQQTQETSFVAAQMKSLQKVAELDGSPVRKAKNGNVFTIEGQYTLTIGDYYFQNSTFSELTINATVKWDSNNQAYSISSNYFIAQVLFDFNASTNTMSFFASGLGYAQDYGYYAAFYPFQWESTGAQGGKTNYLTKLNVQFDNQNGYFEFPADSGFAWLAFSDSSYRNYTGQNFDMFDVVYGLQAGGSIPSGGGNTTDDRYDDDTNWKDAGTAVLVDGWVLPVFGVDPEDPEYWYEVPIQQSTINDNVYRLVDPYHCNPKFDPGDNTSTAKGYIRFDVTDPNHVEFHTGVDAGWANPDAGVMMMFCYNQLGWYMTSYDVPAQTVISQLGDNIPYTTYKNGIVRLDYIVDGGEKIYDAVFGYQLNPLLGGLWPGENMTARIYMPGTAALAILNGTAKAEATDKTATISFDYKALGIGNNAVSAVVKINGKSTRANVTGGHAEVLVEGLEPKTPYTATVTIEVGDGLLSLGSSDPVTVSFTTEAPAQSITVKELRASAPNPAGTTASLEAELETVALPANAQVKTYFKLDKAPYAEYAEMTYNERMNMYVADLSGLTPATDYTVTAYAVSGDVRSEEKTTTFKTPEPPRNPEVTAFNAKADNISTTSADIVVTYTVANAQPDTQVGVAYQLSTDEGDYTKVEGSLEGLTINLSDLKPNTEYTYYLYPTLNGNQAGMETDVTFTTEAAPELPEIPENAEVIYADGKLRQNLNVENWYNAAMNFTAANPTGAENKVFEFKAGNLTYDWGQAGYTDASMGLNMVKPANTGSFHSATLNFGFYPMAAGAKYTVRLTSIETENYSFTITEDQVGKWNTLSLNVAETFPKVAKEWEEDANFGEGYVFSIIIENGTEDDVMYLNNIYYTDVDTEWEAPEHFIAAPETVPVPEHDAENVISVFSSKYEAATGFNIGWWGQSTVAEEQTIAESKVYYLRNFNYLGWELTKDLNVADYDYMHVDFWTADEGAGFGYTPVTREGTVKEKGVEQQVALNEWNSYDIALSFFADAGMDLANVFQIKFDYGKNKNAYVANVYFWKEPATEPEIEYNITGNGSSQLDHTFGAGEELDDAEEWQTEAAYEDGKLYFSHLADSEMPVVFNVDTENWTIKAEEGQLAMMDDYDPEDIWEYYYADIESQTLTVLGKIENTSETTSRVILNPWGMAMEYGDGYFFAFAYFNTVIELDYYFEGAPFAVTFSFNNFTGVASEEDVEAMDFKVDVTVSNLPQDVKSIELYYKKADDSEFQSVSTSIEEADAEAKATTKTVTTTHTFRIPDLNDMAGQPLTLHFYAMAGTAQSELQEVTIDQVTTGVDGIAVDTNDNTTRYYNLQGVQMPSADKLPTGVYVKVVGNTATKVIVK